MKYIIIILFTTISFDALGQYNSKLKIELGYAVALEEADSLSSLDAMGGRFQVGYRLNKNLELGLELGFLIEKNILTLIRENGSGAENGVNAFTVFNQYRMYGVNATYHIKPFSRIHFFTSGGIGLVSVSNFNQVKAQKPNETSFLNFSSDLKNELTTVFPNQNGLTVNLGLGLECKIINPISLKLMGEFKSGVSDLYRIDLKSMHMTDNYLADLSYEKTRYQAVLFSASLIFKIY